MRTTSRSNIRTIQVYTDTRTNTDSTQSEQSQALNNVYRD